ncbi:MAG: DUF1501 domain-containing protein [Gaiellaceae bacterium]
MSDSPRARSCREHTRAEILRRSAATAGAGLPAIEPGMPMPAGTGLDRRMFLARSAGLMLAVYGAGSVGMKLFEEGIAHAGAAAGAGERVLVSVFLDGGIDSLSVLFPTGDPRYRNLRNRLALGEGAGQAFSEDGRLRWHPLAAPLATLHSEGKLSVATAIGYDSPDQSHFTSRHYYEVGATDANLRSGWLGRTLDVIGTPDNPMQGLALDYALQPSLATTRVPVAAVASPSEFSFWARNVWGDVETRMLEALQPLAAASSGNDPTLADARSVLGQMDGVRRQLLPFTSDDEAPIQSPVAYPRAEHEFPQRLAALASMLGANLPIRCVAMSAPGSYDTHDNQQGAFEEGLGITATSLLAFQRDLEARGLADRVLTLVWSEFGRRGKENASLGTDHGAAGLGLVMGTNAAGSMIGEFPGLANGTGLDEDGNLRATSDYRGLYASILEQWLSVDAAQIIPGAAGFSRIPILKPGA